MVQKELTGAAGIYPVFNLFLNVNCRWVASNLYRRSHLAKREVWTSTRELQLYGVVFTTTRRIEIQRLSSPVTVHEHWAWTMKERSFAHRCKQATERPSNVWSEVDHRHLGFCLERGSYWGIDETRGEENTELAERGTSLLCPFLNLEEIFLKPCQ